MKIAVTGPRGRLGSELVRQGCIPFDVDVTDYMALSRSLQEIKPDTVINCAAYTNVDGCEDAPNLAANVNVGGAFGLAQVFRGKIVHVSTDYIFDGRNGPYTETDAPNPISIYGWSKLGGELAIINRNYPDDLIVRTTVLFDRYSRNFVTAVMSQLADAQPVALPDSLSGSPTYIPHLAEAILAAIEAGVCGVLNLAGSRVWSRLEFGKMIALSCGFSMDQITTGPVTGRAPRPLKAGLIVDKAKSLGLPVYDPVDGLKEMAAYALEKVATG